jgi:hypothetical protein
MHADPDSQPTPSEESAPDEELGIRVVSADEMEPASVIADIPDTEVPDSDIPDTEAAEG